MVRTHAFAQALRCQQHRLLALHAAHDTTACVDARDELMEKSCAYAWRLPLVIHTNMESHKTPKDSWYCYVITVYHAQGVNK